MEAVLFDARTLTLKYEKTYPFPTIKNDDEVIVKVEYAGLCGSDLHIIKGEFPGNKERAQPLGHEFSGEIYKVGAKSTFKKGQKVVVDPGRPCARCDFCRNTDYHYCQKEGLYNLVGIFRDGGWAQYVCVPEEQVYLIPEGITTEQAGLCEPYSCVAHGVKRASPIRIGQKILILGAGIIGNLWATVLHHQGHRDVTVSEMNLNRLELFEELETGYRTVTPDILANETTLYDVIIDCTGVGKVIEISVNYLQQGGKYVIFGCCPTSHRVTLSPFEFFDKEITMIGVKINPYSFPTAIGYLKSMGDRYINYRKLGVKTYSLAEYETAIKDLKAGLVSKAVFKIV